MNHPIALALLINHGSRTTFAPDRQQPRRAAPADPTRSLAARTAVRLGFRRVLRAGAAA